MSSVRCLIKHSSSGIPLIDNNRPGIHFYMRANYVSTTGAYDAAGYHEYNFSCPGAPVIAIQLMANRVVTILAVISRGGNDYTVRIYCCTDTTQVLDPTYPYPEVYIFTPNIGVEAMSGAGLKLRYTGGSNAITHSYTAPGPAPLWLRSRVSERGQPNTADAKAIASFTKPAILGIPMHSGYVSTILGNDWDTGDPYGDETIYSYGYMWDGGSNVYLRRFVVKYNGPPVYGITNESITTAADSDSFIINAGLL